MKITLSRDDFHWAAGQGMITTEQAEELWNGLLSRRSAKGAFDLAHLAYYFGAFIVISAMGWFMTLGWERFGGLGIFLISTVYAICFIVAGRTLWFKQNLRVPGGLLFTLAVWMTPLAIYGIERMLGFWPLSDPGRFRDFHEWIRGSWILMELGTVLAGLVALRLVQFPFLTFPIAFALWYMSMDLTPIIAHTSYFTWEQRLWVSAIFGAVILICAYVVDRRSDEDYAFWLYLFGLLAFWGGLSLMESGSQLKKFLYCLINVGLMLLSVLLGRKVFMVFGALGVFGYLGYLSWDVFQNSLMFPFVLTIIGLALIYLGIKYQKNQQRIARFLVGMVPPAWRKLLPSERAVHS